MIYVLVILRCALEYLNYTVVLRVYFHYFLLPSLLHPEFSLSIRSHVQVFFLPILLACFRSSELYQITCKVVLLLLGCPSARSSRKSNKSISWFHLNLSKIYLVISVADFPLSGKYPPEQLSLQQYLIIPNKSTFLMLFWDDPITAWREKKNQT